jgi:hypothetical protein
VEVLMNKKEVEHLTIQIYSYYRCFVVSRDCSGKPFEIKTYFFLVCQSDQRKLLASLRKKGFDEKACSEKHEKAPEKTTLID